jgi:signal transduction histidine kinase
VTIATINPSNAQPPRVLVVDDEPANRLLLRELLEGNGYLVLEAVNGEEGLVFATDGRPDVILLDIMMPKLDGYEVCRRLKAAPETRAVPVLMVTSLSERRERLEGIRAGANDLVTKPIDRADLLLRVRNAVVTKQLYDQMENQYVRLRELESLRDSLVHMLVHDVRTPLSSLSAYVELLGMDLTNFDAEEAARSVVELKTLVRRMSDMVDTVLDLNRMEAGKMPLDPQEIDLRALLREAVQALGPRGVERVRLELPDKALAAVVDQELIGRVVINLVGNALKFSRDGIPVLVSVDASDAEVEVSVRDSGPGIPEADLGIIFEKFGQARTQQRNHGTGLGLTFCRMAVEAHGGGIGARSAVGAGSIFWFRLPRGLGEVRAAS